MNTAFILEIEDGKSFLHLLKYLKNVVNGMLTFTKESIKYNDLIDSESPVIIGNEFTIYTQNLAIYIFESDTPEYLLFFDIKGLKNKIKNIKPKDRLKMYKKKGESTIYVQVIKPGDIPMSVAFLTPLNMVSYQIFMNESFDDDKLEPNFTVTTLRFKDECSKIVPKDHKSIAMRCKDNCMDIKCVSHDESEGHLIKLGDNTPSIPINLNVKIDLSRLRLDAMNAPPSPKVRVIKGTKEIFINLSSSAFKSLSGITQLSNKIIKFFFDNKDYIKMESNISNYGVIKTYINNDPKVIT